MKPLVKVESIKTPHKASGIKKSANFTKDSIKSIAQPVFDSGLTPIRAEGNPFILNEVNHNDTMPELNAFLRKGILYKQHKKTK